MLTKHVGLAGFACCLWACMASAQEEPLSTIDWLSETLRGPQTVPPAGTLPLINLDATVRSLTLRPGGNLPEQITTPEVTVEPLGAPKTRAVGLSPPSATGLPHSLWTASDPETLAPLLRAIGTPTIPAMQQLLRRLLVAEADTPITRDPEADILVARVDALLAMGDVETSLALLDQAGAMTPQLFARWFDLSLLTGTEDAACTALMANAALRAALPTRVFCLSRTGDWNAAALTLKTGEALGEIPADKAALLAQFLDPELAEESINLAPRRAITPLEFTLRRAIGTPFPTTKLPLAYATTALTPDNGWKTQIDAAIRLARTGSLSSNRLLDVMTANIPSASGGVWELAEAWQRLDISVTARNPSAISRALPTAWVEARKVGVQTAMADLYSEPLKDLPLTGPAQITRAEMMLVSPLYESVSAEDTANTDLAFAQSVAVGTPIASLAGSLMERIIVDGFATNTLSPQNAELLRQGKLGEILVRAIVTAEQAATGDLRDIAQVITLLRQTGLESTARQLALNLLLIDRLRT